MNGRKQQDKMSKTLNKTKFKLYSDYILDYYV